MSDLSRRELNRIAREKNFAGCCFGCVCTGGVFGCIYGQFGR